MNDVFYQSMAVNHNIVTVYNAELAFHSLQVAVYPAHQLAGCIRQFKWQDSPLVKSNLCGKGCLWAAPCCDANLMITCCQGPSPIV